MTFETDLCDQGVAFHSDLVSCVSCNQCCSLAGISNANTSILLKSFKEHLLLLSPF